MIQSLTLKFVYCAELQSVYSLYIFNTALFSVLYVREKLAVHSIYFSSSSRMSIVILFLLLSSDTCFIFDFFNHVFPFFSFSLELWKGYRGDSCRTVSKVKGTFAIYF